MSYWICVVQDICPITVQMKVSPWLRLAEYKVDEVYLGSYWCVFKRVPVFSPLRQIYVFGSLSGLLMYIIIFY